MLGAALHEVRAPGSERPVISLNEMAAVLRKRGLERPITFLLNAAIPGSTAAGLEEAIVLLEVDNVRALSVSILWSRKLPRAMADEYWRRAFLVASIARHWAYRGRRVDPERAFLAGLLQQIGRLRLSLRPFPNRDCVEEGLRVARRFAFAQWAKEVIATAGTRQFAGSHRELALLVDLARCCAEWLAASRDSAEILTWISTSYEGTDVLFPGLRELKEPHDEAMRIWARFPLRAARS